MYDYISEYSAECTVASSQSGNMTGNCDMDVDECASHPCQHNATCLHQVIEWECDCVEVTNIRTGHREAYDGELCENSIDVCT